MKRQNAEKTMFPSVQVIRDAGTAFLCLIEAKPVWVPLDEIRYGSELAQVGDRGRLFVSRWFARNLSLGGPSVRPAHALATERVEEHTGGGRGAARRFRSEPREPGPAEARSVRLRSRP